MDKWGMWLSKLEDKEMQTAKLDRAAQWKKNSKKRRYSKRSLGKHQAEYYEHYRSPRRRRGRQEKLFESVQFISADQSYLTLRDPMSCSTPGLPVHQQLPGFTQTHFHWVGDAIQPSHPLSSPSPPAFKLSQHQGQMKQFFASSGQSIGASASVLPVNTQGWFPLGLTGQDSWLEVMLFAF